MKAKASKQPSPWLAGALSLVLPGLGQVYARQRYRGGAVLIAFLVVLGMVAWYGEPRWYFAPVGIWLWNIWDAVGQARQRRVAAWLPLLLGLTAAYSIGWQMVRVDFTSANWERGLAVLRPMFRPDLFERRAELNRMWTPISVPCSAAQEAPPARRQEGDKLAFATPDCAGVLETVIVSVSGMWPNTDTEIWWETNIGDDKPLGGNENAPLIVQTDETGSLTTTIRVPSTILIAQPDPTLQLTHRIYFDQRRPIGGLQFSTNGGFVVKGMTESVTMALMATFLAVLLAVPVSFLAARNLMSANPFTFAVYVVVRTLLNFVRSIESLILAIVFVIIVGLGPFAGVLALTVHSVAALAKLYSEVIEGIDPGPIEAVRATGANWVQVVRYGVIPQIVPPFTAFTIYRWDINVRSSTVIGMVGGGGIGFYLIQWIALNDMRAVGAAFIAIALVVMTLDYVSARIRERLV
ncbi:MAG: phosphonate ABC transporter, permease protein PhnE [Anaerolineales bacterium]